MSTRTRARTLGWISALLAAGTVFTGLTGIATMAAQPAHEVQIELDAGLPLNISAETVQAALRGEPPRSWAPLTLRVTEDLLTADQRRRGADAGADVVLSIPRDPEDLPDTDVPARFDGAGIRTGALPAGTDPWDAGWDITEEFRGNRDLGHGPSAVVAAARTAGELTYAGPPRAPMLWIGLVLGGLALTVISLLWWARIRRREAELLRSYRAGRSDLARVLLDQEALEVSFLTVPEEQRPEGFAATWDWLEEDSLALARREAELSERMGSSAAADRAGLGAAVESFRADARALAVQASALEQSSRVHARTAGDDTVLDRVADPLVRAARSLLVRVDAAPEGTVAAEALAELRAGLDHLLDLLTAWQRKDPEDVRRRWEAAEQRLGRAAEEISRQLERYPTAAPLEPWGTGGVAGVVGAAGGDEAEELAALRTNLGLTRNPSGRADHHLVRANAVARNFLGDHPDLDTGAAARAAMASPTTASAGATGTHGSGELFAPVTGRRRASGEESRRWVRDRDAGGGTTVPQLTRLSWVLVAVAAAVVTLIPAALVAGAVTARPGWELIGDQPVDTVQIDGPEIGDLSEEDILRFVDGAFVEPIDVTVAVRRAESYVERTGESSEYSYEVDPEVTVEALWRLKSEFPEKVDPATGELRPGVVIVPVMVWGHEESAGVMYPLTGAVSLGDQSRLAPFTHERSSVQRDDFNLLDVVVGNALEDVGRGLQSNGLNRPDIGAGALTLILWAALFAGAISLVVLLETLAGLSRGLGRLGRGQLGLQRVTKRLEQLMLGIDESRLSAVAVLGAGPAGSPREAEQRLYERALVAAWREAEEIAALPLGGRMREEVLARVDRLERSVGRIVAREGQVQAQAEAPLREQR